MTGERNEEIAEKLVCAWEDDSMDGAETRLVRNIKEALDQKDSTIQALEAKLADRKEWQEVAQKNCEENQALREEVVVLKKMLADQSGATCQRLLYESYEELQSLRAENERLKNKILSSIPQDYKQEAFDRWHDEVLKASQKNDSLRFTIRQLGLILKEIKALVDGQVDIDDYGRPNLAMDVMTETDKGLANPVVKEIMEEK